MLNKSRGQKQRILRAVERAIHHRINRRVSPPQSRKLDYAVEQLESRLLLDGSPLDLSQFKQFSTAVTDVDKNVTQMLNNNPLPLLGSKIADNISAFEQQFINLGNSLQGALSNATDNPSDITAALQNIGLTNFDGSQLKTLVDNETGSNPNVEYQAGWTSGAITVKPSLNFDLGLSALGLDITSNVTFDVSVTPTFKIDFGVNSSGFYINTTNTSFQLAASVKIDPSSTGLSGTLADFLEFKAVDATSNNTVYNPKNPSPAVSPTALSATFSAGLTSSSGSLLTISDLNSLSTAGINMSLTGGLNLGLAMQLGLDLGAASAVFPTLYSDLSISWPFGTTVLSASGINTDSSGFGTAPTIAFDNVAVDFGSFITSYVEPVISRLNQLAEPFKPIIDFLNKPAPVFNDYSLLSNIITDEVNNNNMYSDQHGLIQNNVITMADLFVYGGDVAPTQYGGGDYSSIVSLAQSLEAIYKVQQALSNFSPTGMLNLGSFQVTGDARGQSNLQGDAGTGSMSDADVAQESDSLLSSDPNDPDMSDLAPDTSSDASPVASDGLSPADSSGSTSAPATGIDFPILRDPTQIFEMLLGKQDVNLFTYNSPQLTVGQIPFQQTIVVYWPFAIDLHGDLPGGNNTAFDITGQISVGYDTQGFIDFAKSKNPLDLMDGFFIKDSSNLNFNFGIAADGSVNLYVVAAGVGGGLNGQVSLTLNDPDKSTDGGEMHLPAIENAFSNSIFGPIDLQAKVTFVLNAFVTFSFGPFTHTFQDNLLNVTLLDWNSASQPAAPPALAHFASGNTGELVLNMGPDASQRGSGDTSDDNEDFTVTLLKDNPDGSEKVNVAYNGYNDIYDEVTGIQAFGGGGTNDIEINQGVDVPVQLYAGFDPNTSNSTEVGGDTIDDQGSGQFTIYGSSGNDTIRVNTGNTQDPSKGGFIDGAGESDMIDVHGPMASGAHDTLYAGNDYLYNPGYGDNDSESSTIIGSSGNDTIRTYSRLNENTAQDYIDPGGGNDTITQAGASDLIQADTIVAHDGNNGSILFEPGDNYNTFEMYGVGGDETILAEDANTVFGSGPHDLYVAAETGVFGSGPTESFTSLTANGISGINNLVLDATGGNPNTTTQPGDLTYIPPAGAININLGDLTKTGVQNIQINSFAASFASSNANPTILTITGPANPHRIDFDFEAATTTVNGTDVSGATSQSSTYSGSSLAIAVSDLDQDVDVPVESIALGDAPGDKVIYNAAAGTNNVYLNGSPGVSTATLVYNSQAGNTDAIHVAQFEQNLSINQNGANLTVYAGGQDNELENGSTTLADLPTGLVVAGLVADSNSPSGFAGSINLILDDTAQTSHETGTLTTYLNTLHQDYVAINGFTPTDGIFVPTFTNIEFTLGYGGDSFTLEANLPINLTLVGGVGSDSIAAQTNDSPLDFTGDTGGDTVYGTGLGDSIQGGAGANLITEAVPANSSTPPDTLLGGGSNDTIYATGGDESINGGAGNDYLSYSLETNTPSQPTLVGGEGSDNITVYGGTPLIYTDSYGGAQNPADGHDTVQGTASNATLYGGEGVDTFELGYGSTQQVGGIQVPNDFAAATIYFGQGTGDLYAAAGPETLNCNGNNVVFYGSSAAPADTPLTITSGTLQVAVIAGYPDLSNYDITVNSSATLQAINNQTIGSLAGSGTVITPATGYALTTGADNASTTFTGNISGTGGLTKTGSGTFICAVPTYTGPTNIQAGLFRLTSHASNAYLSTFTKSNNIYTNLNEQFPHTGTGTPGSGHGTANASFLFDPTPSAVQNAGYAAGYLATSNLVNNGVDFNLTSDASGHDFEEITSGNTLTVPANLFDVSSIYALVAAYNSQTVNITLTGADGTTQVFNNVTVPDFSGGTVNTSGTNFTDRTLFQTHDVGGGGTGNSTTGVTTNYDLTEIALTLSPALASEQLNSISFKANGSTILVFGVTAAQQNIMPSAVTVSGGANFDVNNLALAIGSLSGAGHVALGTGSLSTGTDNTSTTFAGLISDSGSVTKVGAGIWTLSSSNSYTGPFTAAGGTTNFNSLSALGSGTAININGATIQYAAGTTDDISTRTLTFGLNGATIDTNGNNVTYANSVGNSGAGSFTKTGSGILTLKAAGTWKGSTSITGGTLQAGITNSLPTATDLNIGSNGTFDLNNLNQSIGSLSGSGNVKLGSATLTSGAGSNTNSTTFAGTISGTGSLNKIGASVLTLSGSSTYTGGTTIDATGLSTGKYGLSVSSDANLGDPSGFLRFTSSSGTLFTTGSFATGRSIQLYTASNGSGDYINVASGTTFTVSGIISTSATSPAAPLLEKDATGTLILNNVNTWGANNGYNGLQISQGMVGLGIANAIPDLLVNESFGGAPTAATLDLNGFNQRLAGISGGTAGSLLSIVTDSSSTSAALTIDGSSEFDFGGKITGAHLSLVINGFQSFDEGGAGTVGQSTYGGGTTILSGRLRTGFTTTVTNGSFTTGPLGLGPVTLGATSGSNSAELDLTNGGSIYNPVTVVGGSSGTLTLGGGGNGGAGTYGGAIAINHDLTLGTGKFIAGISGTGNINTAAQATITLSGTNAYSGSTTVNVGVSLQFGNANALPANTALSILNGTPFGGVNFASFNQTVGSLTETSLGDANHGTITLGSATLTTGNDNTSTIFDGIISGTGSVIKTGTGIWTIGNSQTYTGSTAVNGGTLTLGTGSSLTSSNVSVASGANLNVNVNAGLPANTTLSVAGNATFAKNTGAGILTRILASLSLHTGGQVMLAAPANPSSRTLLSLGALTFDGSQNNWGGLLDLTTNDLVVHNGNAANLANQVNQASNNFNWNGPAGITSSSANMKKVLAVVPNSNSQGHALLSSYDGQPASATDVFVKFTNAGDANLDSTVDSNDFSILAANYGKTSNVSWLSGDFNGDGTVNALDFNALATNYGDGSTSGDIPASDSEDLSTSVQSVPDMGGNTQPQNAIVGKHSDNAGTASRIFSNNPISSNLFGNNFNDGNRDNVDALI